jgi:hypothetical protein
MPGRTLKRDATTYEFIVRYPHGTSAINGYRRAARHFGLHTLEDPTTHGGDSTRLLIHRDASALRAAWSKLSTAYTSDEADDVDQVEMWLATESGVHWFDHDWQYWAAEQDQGALEQLGWRRRVVTRGGGLRVTVTRGSRTPQRGRSRGR